MNKTTSFSRFTTIASLKVKLLSKNTSAIVMPFMSIGIVVLLRLFYQSLGDEASDSMAAMFGIALSMGLSMNLGSGAIMMSALPLAEETEKYTLRTLMTSSVTAPQFFIGSLVPPVVITFVVNFLLIFVSGIPLEGFNFLLFGILSLVGALISCMIGLLIGIVSKSQMNASNISTPVIMIIALMPTFALTSDFIQTISEYLYTGIIDRMISAHTQGFAFVITPLQIIVFILSLIIPSIAFFYFYKKKSMESA